MSSATIRVLALTENPLSSPRTASSEVCTDSYEQGWAHLATRVVHILYWTPDFPIFADSQHRCLGWQLNPDRKQGTSGDASPIPRLLSTQKAVWEQHKGSDQATLLLRFRVAGLSPFPLLPCPAYFTGWKCARLFSAWSHQSIPLLVQGLTQLSHASAVIKKSHKRDLPMHLGSLSPAIASQGATKYMALQNTCQFGRFRDLRKLPYG